MSIDIRGGLDCPPSEDSGSTRVSNQRGGGLPEVTDGLFGPFTSKPEESECHRADLVEFSDDHRTHRQYPASASANEVIYGETVEKTISMGQ